MSFFDWSLTLTRSKGKYTIMPKISAMKDEIIKIRVECYWPNIENMYNLIVLYIVKNVNPHNIDP